VIDIDTLMTSMTDVQESRSIKERDDKDYLRSQTEKKMQESVIQKLDNENKSLQKQMAELTAKGQENQNQIESLTQKVALE